MSACILCTKSAVKQFTWLNRLGQGAGGGRQGGPMCEACMSATWESLARFPAARETVTIAPVAQTQGEA